MDDSEMINPSIALAALSNGRWCLEYICDAGHDCSMNGASATWGQFPHWALIAKVVRPVLTSSRRAGGNTGVGTAAKEDVTLLLENPQK